VKAIEKLYSQNMVVRYNKNNNGTQNTMVMQCQY